MNLSKINLEIPEPKNQLNLYGYDNYFAFFKTLHEKNKLPSSILLSGPKGIGKSTLVYHFANYLLSQKQTNSYSVQDFQINDQNHSYKLIQDNIHPNFFLLDSSSSEASIKIEQSRNLLKFLHKTTYSQKIKIVFLDNLQYLNLKSSNALLKALEEPPENTYFFLIHHDSSFILNTIKSRCVNFRFHFNIIEKKDIFKKLVKNCDINFTDDDLNKFFNFDSPGNLKRYLITLKDSQFNISKDTLPCIFFLMDLYKNLNDTNLLNLISLLIETYYNDQIIRNNENIERYFIDKHKILYLIDDMKKFNLNKKNLLISIGGILKNEAK